MNIWRNTKIWEALTQLNNSEVFRVKSFLEDPLCMDKIERILNSGGSSPKDFTLHDADHSFRVAERMWEIIPVSTQKILSEYELALLLLSAYLHDIGMTPEYGKVRNHFLCLNASDKTVLTELEKRDFQKWLDEEGEQIDLEKDSLDDFDKSGELVTYYCRYKHNDWSEDWIRTSFNNKQLGNYTNWLNDLINICRSHHYGLEELKLEKFNPIRIHGKVIHKRYLAMSLRLADVIEIDPERAPEVLIKHRSVINESLSHWLKEKFTSVDIVNYCILVTATPDKAFIQKAILDVADQIDREANLCNTLVGEISLKNIVPSNDLTHEWKILPSISRNITPAGNYEYIDGTFKPNPNKLLQLLAGTELYGNPILAIRELIQNAFDAIKVQQAYIILQDTVLEESERQRIRDKFFLKLVIEKENDEYWINCIDNGVGMDKEVIKKCFLIGGASKRQEILELERKCSRIDYKLELTGRFGIGVMSYFMLADKMIISTKKSFQSGSFYAHGWEFEINGLSDFGELRKYDCNTNGSIIKLRIKKEFQTNFDDHEKITKLIVNSLNRIPCKFEFVLFGKQIVDYSSGWCKDENYFKDKLEREFAYMSLPDIETSTDLLTEDQLGEIETSVSRKIELDQKFRDSLYFISNEGKLKNDNGYFRVTIPIFKNKWGESFVFFFEDLVNPEILLMKMNKGYLYRPGSMEKLISWKGIITGINNKRKGNDVAIQNYHNSFVELDLINEKSFQISVSRLELNVIETKENIWAEVQEKINTLITLHKENLLSSSYALFNRTWTSILPIRNENLYWSLSGNDVGNFLKIEKVKFPLIFYGLNGSIIGFAVFYLEKRVFQLGIIKSCGPKHRDIDHQIYKNSYKFDRAVFRESNGFELSFLIIHSLKSNKFSFVGNTAQFPKEWDKLFCWRGSSEYEVVMNENSPYFNFINREDYLFVTKFFRAKEPLNSSNAKAIIESKSKSFCFVMYLISIEANIYWLAMIQNNHQFLNQLWNKMFDEEPNELYFLSNNKLSTHLTIISSTIWKKITSKDEIYNYLPKPPNDWIIQTKEG